MKFYIKEARERIGYSQKELAEIIGVAPNTLHGYESGKHDPKSKLLIQIAQICKVSVDFLLGRTNDAFAPTLTTDETDLLLKFRSFNDEGKEKVVTYISDLDRAGIYKNNDKSEMVSQKA